VKRPRASSATNKWHCGTSAAEMVRRPGAKHRIGSLGENKSTTLLSRKAQSAFVLVICLVQSKYKHNETEK